MSSEYDQITKLLAIEQEHFEDEVRRLVLSIEFHWFIDCHNEQNLSSLLWLIIFSILQGISTAHLMPLQVLQAIQHAQLWLDYTFTKEDFLQGKVGTKMIQEDFNFEENVSHHLLSASATLQQCRTMLSNCHRPMIKINQEIHQDSALTWKHVFPLRLLETHWPFPNSRFTITHQIRVRGLLTRVCGLRALHKQQTRVSVLLTHLINISAPEIVKRTGTFLQGRTRDYVWST